MTPTVSVVIATLNSARWIEECLEAIRSQDHDAEAVEVIIADGGSDDGTPELALAAGADRVVPNPLRTAEAGKAAGVRAATGELICSIDSDNTIVGTDWLSRMVEPFADPEVISSEALRWHYDPGETVVNRWHALSAVSEPLGLYLGNYARQSVLTGRWTDCPHQEERTAQGWLKVRLHPDHVPTMGANGYVVRRSAFDVVPIGDYLFDIDHAYELVQAGHGTIAKVDVAVHHHFCDGVAQFVRKTRRRAADYFYFDAQDQRSYPWTTRQSRGIVDFVLATALVLPVLREALRGQRAHPDAGAWLFHVIACWVTLAVYGTATIRGRIAPKMLDRKGWKQ